MERGPIELMVEPTMIRFIQTLILFAISRLICGLWIGYRPFIVYSYYSGDIETVTYCENIRNKMAKSPDCNFIKG